MRSVSACVAVLSERQAMERKMMQSMWPARRGAACKEGDERHPGTESQVSGRVTLDLRVAENRASGYTVEGICEPGKRE